MKSNDEMNRKRLLHILEAIERIENFSQKIEEKDFYTDFRINNVILFQLSIIGEAIIHVDTSLLNKYNYPWHEVRALRNVIAHEYFDIKLEIIWSVVENDLQGLREVLQKIISDHS